jgi:hypothetical protein
VETETKNTVPMWLAVAITVVISLPFGLWLKEWSVPLWAAFIVWAEYFVLGGKPAGLKIMVPSYILGVIGAVLVLILMVEMPRSFSRTRMLVSATDVAIGIAFFIGFCVLIYAMKFMPVTGGAGTLPFFNGISMGLATYFCLGIYFCVRRHEGRRSSRADRDRHPGHPRGTSRRLPRLVQRHDPLPTPGHQGRVGDTSPRTSSPGLHADNRRQDADRPSLPRGSAPVGVLIPAERDARGALLPRKIPT